MASGTDVLKHAGDLKTGLKGAAAQEVANRIDLVAPEGKIHVNGGQAAAVALDFGVMVDLRIDGKGSFSESIEQALEEERLDGDTNRKQVSGKAIGLPSAHRTTSFARGGVGQRQEKDPAAAGSDIRTDD